MLPNISLDTDRYKDIVDSAKNMIASIYPEWTDFNYHDPGITLLELFAWIKESQQYYLDQIGDEHRKKYLKLLGLRPRTKVPAKAEVEIVADQDLDVLKGTKFYAGEICFEAEERVYISKNHIARCISYDQEQVRVIDRNQLDLGNKLRILPFGQEPQVGNRFYLAFDEPLPTHTVLRVVVELFEDYKVKRNPIREPEVFHPLAELAVEVFTSDGWQAITLVADETHALLYSGSIRICIDHDMAPYVLHGFKGYYLRLCLLRCEYDVPPVIQAIRINSVPVRQRDTRSEMIDFPLAADGQYRAATELSITGVNQLYAWDGEGYTLIPTVTKRIDYEHNCAVFEVDTGTLPEDAKGVRLVNTTSDFANKNMIGYGTGLPFQEFDLNDKHIEYESFEIMTEDPEIPDRYLPWQKVSDFSSSTPADRHYVFDSAAGVVKFGDCKKGMAPEGTIIITGYVNVLGAGGNVKQNTINRIGPEELPGVQITNKANATGGEDEETLDDCFKRARKMLKKPRSAVTYADYEDYVLKTPGLMIESCKVIPAAHSRRQGSVYADTVINIVIKPFYPEQAETISDAYMRNIQNYLEKFRLLGTKIELTAPEYIGVTVYSDVTLKPHYVNGPAMVEEAVKNFFLRYKDQFGAEIVYSELYGVIDRLECVSAVSALSMDAKGNGISRTKEGNIVLPPNGIVVLRDTQFMFSVEP